MTAFTIDRVALRGGAGVSRRRRVLARLGRVDPVAPGAPNELLVVSRMADPLPGALARAAGEGGPLRWERALAAELGRLRDRAVRPGRGDMSDASEAVVFADEAEMRACLAECLAAGRPPPWWARAALRRLRPGGGAAALLAERPHLLPAICDVLIRRGSAAAVFAAMTPAQVETLSRDILGLPALSPTAPGGPESPEATLLPRFPAVARPETREVPTGVPLEVLAAIRTLPAAAGELLALLWLRRHRPALTGARLAQAAPALARSAGTTAMPAVQEADSGERPEAVPTRGLTTDVGPGRLSPPPKNEYRADAPVPPLVSAPSVPDLPASRIRRDPAAAAGIPLNGTPDAPSATAPTASAETDALSGSETATGLGGVFFLVNLYVGAIPIRAPELADRLAAAAREGDGAWTALERLARAISEIDTGDRAAEATDPLWRLLALLDGRSPEDAAEPDTADLTAADAASDWIGTAAWGPQGPPDGMQAADLLRLPARVFATPVHLDVVFSAEAVSLPARRAGLDLDPGWQPRFGRIVAFHYRE